MAPLWDRSMNLAAILMGAAAVTSASAQSFHVDFGSFALGFGVPSSGYGAAANAAGHWNLVDSDQLGSGVFTTPPLRTTANASSGVVLELDPLGGRFFPFEENAPLTTGDDQRLLDDCCYTLGDSELRFRGLAAGVYQVLTYALAPDDATFRTGVAVSGSLDPLQSVGGDFSQGFVRGVTDSEHTPLSEAAFDRRVSTLCLQMRPMLHVRMKSPGPCRLQAPPYLPQGET